MCTRLLQLGKHLSSLKELELNALLHNLQQPADLGSDSLQSCVSTLQSINDIRQLPGHEQKATSDWLRLYTIEV